jgi:hypothetical protein
MAIEHALQELSLLRNLFGAIRQDQRGPAS